MPSLKTERSNYVQCKTLILAMQRRLHFVNPLIFSGLCRARATGTLDA